MKKGLSPVVATILLVAVVILVALIVFLWFRGMETEGLTKFGENINKACGDVKFNAGYSLGELVLTNTGEVPIYGIKVEYGGEKKDLKEISDWPDYGLDKGQTFRDDVSFGSGNKVEFSPVIIGESNDGNQAFKCSNVVFKLNI